MYYISLINHYEGIKLSINVFSKPLWNTPTFNREMGRYIDPERGEVSRGVALARVIEILNKK